ncbi:UNVERIFIED_CONTAM: Thaumatin-like protein 1 [Sesamum latifolium]|uniref:Thaumatin-like protein 1 n=1 Tax=Sesamum latifolium TaxID=2727402 RepID=A0AAW2WDQ3_9LAMI
MSSTSSSSSYALHITLLFLLMAQGSLGTVFTLVNRCDYTVWPGISSNAGSSGLDTTGFQLPPRATSTGIGRCDTGDCGSNQIECNGAGATPPATLAEFTIGSGNPDFYDVSLVDGYNVPMIIQPAGGSGACGSTGCVTDVNRMCPNELRAGDGLGCKSACEAFGSPEYCCRDAYASPATCRPSVYSEMFKSACPRSYSYAFDDATSTFTCSGADYTITFCPSLTSQKSSRDSSSSPTTTAGSWQPPPAVDDSDSGPQDDLASWLPNFVIGGSPDLALHSSTLAVCVGAIFLSLTFLQL